MEPVTVSITVESIISEAPGADGEHYVTAVKLSGASFAHPETIRDLAQEAIDSTYGNVSHRRVAVFTHEDWQNMRRAEPESITVPVHTF